MAEEKKKTTRKRKKTSKITLDKNELSEIITNAMLEYDKKKEEQKVQKYYDADNKKIGVDVWMFLKMLFFPKKYVNTQDANSRIVKSILSFIYLIFRLALYLTSAILLICSISWLIPSLNQGLPAGIYVVYLCGSIVSLLIARVIKVMSLDVKRNQDNNFLISLLALIISLVSMIIAIIALK